MLRPRLHRPLLLGLLACAGLATPGCGGGDGPAAAGAATPPPREAPAAAPSATAEALRTTADEVAAALAASDLGTLAGHVHPRRGVRFSPYTWIDPDEHVTLSPAELRSAAAGEPVRRVWGRYDGSGEPIELTLGEYLERFVYDRPYRREGRVALDRRQGQGNTLDNLGEVYPEARVVEYHLPGEDPRYGGMDWRSLRLAFVDEDGRWLLVAVVHDEWTI